MPVGRNVLLTLPHSRRGTEAIGLLRREQIELQTRVRTAEEAQFGAEQDAVGLRAQLEEARRGPGRHA